MKLKHFIKSNWYFIIIFIIYLFIHIYKLTKVPYGLHIDEAGMAYDAYNLSKYGVDRYLFSYPVYLYNSGGGQSVLYCYLCVLLFKFLPFTTFVIRIPSLLNSILIFIYGSLIINKFLKSKKLTILYMFLITIMPYFIMVTRIGLDCNLMLGFSTMFIYYLSKTITSNKKICYFISGIIGGIVLYTYVLSYIIVPLFLLITLIYMIHYKKAKLKNILIFIIPFIILAIPLIIVQIINIFNLDQLKIFNLTFTKLMGYRGHEISIFNVIKNIIPLTKSILLYDWLPYNTIPKYGTIYYISIPFFIIGLFKTIYKFIKEKTFNINNIILFWFISTYILGLLLGGDGVNANKINSIFVSVTYFTVLGINYYVNYFIKYRKILITILILVYIYFFINFFNFYYYKYTSYNDPLFLFEYSIKDVLSRITNSDLKEKNIFVDQKEIYFLCDTLMSAEEINKYEWKYNIKNYYIYLPRKIDDSAIYIIKKNNKDYINKLKDYEFEIEEYKDYYLFYKK